MTNTHGLRTTGRPTGNFGKAKVQGKRESLDFSPSILNRDELNIPNRDSSISRLEEAFVQTSDPRMKAVIGDMLRKFRAQAIQTPKPPSKPDTSYWDEIKRVR